jgi:hypothetical protein
MNLAGEHRTLLACFQYDAYVKTLTLEHKLVITESQQAESYFVVATEDRSVTFRVLPPAIAEFMRLRKDISRNEPWIIPW